MSDKRRHRGPHPSDKDLFADAQLPTLRTAVAELSWLLTRGYPDQSALKLVGDRHQLVQRQRIAVRRSSCADQALQDRSLRRTQLADVPSVNIDGFNLLTTLEAALAGGVVLQGRDTCYRDMASMHGSYRKVEETLTALELAGQTFADAGVSTACWFLDEPVSNSGRLAQIIRETAGRCGWDWNVELVRDPDVTLLEHAGAIVSADSQILDNCGLWCDAARAVIERHVSDAWLVSLA